jgi:hypothetical protein
MHMRYLWDSQEERDHYVGGWILLKCILERQDGVVWTESICLRIGTSGGSCEHGNEPPDSINCWEVLAYLHNWWLLKDSAP